MAKILIAGSGFAGHYAALVLQDELKRSQGQHEITVVTPNKNFIYLPSLVWVGIDKMDANKVQFPLEPVYNKLGIKYIQGRLTEVYPDNNRATIQKESDKNTIGFDYDYILVATGPKLNFEGTPGLGPITGNTYSICTPPHAIETSKKYLQIVEKTKKGEKAKVVIGTGHGGATCQGAAFEYICNVHNDLVDRGLRDNIELTWLSNEPKPGDFGIDGFEAKDGGMTITAEMMINAIFEDYGIKQQIQSHVNKVDEKKIYIENVAGENKELEYDFAMLIPQFKGHDIKWVDKTGNDIKEKMCNPAGFVKVDAVYGKPYEELDGPDWPKTYQNPLYKNIFSAGIAFAPPGPLSKPSKSPNGTVISPAPPRTGYTSELAGKAAAMNIAAMINGKEPTHTASMGETAGLCIASMKSDFWGGTAGTIAVYPVARDRKRFPGSGRDTEACIAEVGMAGAWMKWGLHHGFLYKLKALPFWKLIP